MSGEGSMDFPAGAGQEEEAKEEDRGAGSMGLLAGVGVVRMQQRPLETGRSAIMGPEAEGRPSSRGTDCPPARRQRLISHLHSSLIWISDGGRSK